MDEEQLAQESALWPWLDSDCMAEHYEDDMSHDMDEWIDDEP